LLSAGDDRGTGVAASIRPARGLA